MLRVAGRRLSSWRCSAPTSSALRSPSPINADSYCHTPRSLSHPRPFFSDLVSLSHIRGLSSGSLAPAHDLGFHVPATVAAIQNPTSKITYDEHNHERHPAGDPSKHAFAYFVLTGGRFVYASLIRLLVLKFVLSMSASKDVLALASLEVDLSSIEPGTTVTVKWRGKPVFIRRRTGDDINLAKSVDINALRDPQEDAVRVKNPEWLVVIGVCTNLGCIPLTLVDGFAHAMGPIMISLAEFARDQPHTIWRCLLTAS